MTENDNLNIRNGSKQGFRGSWDRHFRESDMKCFPLRKMDGVQIGGGYISADYCEVKYALNEGRKLDLKAPGY